METRAVPALPAVNDNTTTYKTRLQRVTAIIRHGARTPIHTKNCWKGHWDEPDGIWDCGLKTVLSTRPYHEGQNDPDDRGQFLVEKIYDAFLGEKAPSPYRNIMNGTCQDGQLIQQGYDQQIENGKHLRRAYVYDDLGDENGEGDPRLRLFPTSVLAEAGSDNGRFLDGLIRLRSDDDQRTLASGQILLSSMFGPEAAAYRRGHNGAAPVLAHHTADGKVDIVSSWQRTWRCPQQKEVIGRAVASEAYNDFYHSEESHKIRQLIDDELEPEGVHFGGLDCMMTSMCTDRGLPDVINDYRKPVDENDTYTKKYDPNRFDRLRDYVVQNMTFINRFNDSELSKMDMGPLWAEIVESKEDLALFSGHDSTIYPLMMSLGEKVWNATDFPPYGSMMLIELHDVIDKKSGAPPGEFPSGKAFRLVYNGRVLTWLMDGCPENSHLCDASIFLDRVTPFATRNDHGCGDEEDPAEEAGGGDGRGERASYALVDSGEMRFWMLSMASSFALGTILTCLVMRCLRSHPRRRQRLQSHLVESEGFSDEPDVVVD